MTPFDCRLRSEAEKWIWSTFWFHLMLVIEFPKVVTECMCITVGHGQVKPTLRFLRIDPGTVSVASQTDPVVAKNRPDQWSVIFRSFQFGLRLSCCTQMNALDMLKRYVR